MAPMVAVKVKEPEGYALQVCTVKLDRIHRSAAVAVATAASDARPEIHVAHVLLRS